MQTRRANVPSECLEQGAEQICKASVQIDVRSKGAAQMCKVNVQSNGQSKVRSSAQSQCATHVCRTMCRAMCRAMCTANMHRKCAKQMRSLARSSCSQRPMCQRRSRLCRSVSWCVPIRSMPSRSVSIRAVPIRAVLSRVPRRSAHSAIGVDDCRIRIVSEQLSSSFVQFAPVRSCCRLMLHCIVGFACRSFVSCADRARMCGCSFVEVLHLHLLVARPLSPRYRVQSAPVCGCSFVKVLVHASSSRDYCRLVIVCSPRPCAAAASSKCSFALPRRATTVAS